MRDPWKLRAIVETFRGVDKLVSVAEVGQLMGLPPKANSLSNLMCRLHREGVLGRTTEVDDATMNSVYRYYLLQDDFKTFTKKQLQNVANQLTQAIDKFEEERVRVGQKIDVTKFALQNITRCEGKLSKSKADKKV